MLLPLSIKVVSYLEMCCTTQIYKHYGWDYHSIVSDYRVYGVKSLAEIVKHDWICLCLYNKHRSLNLKKEKQNKNSWKSVREATGKKLGKQCKIGQK